MKLNLAVAKGKTNHDDEADEEDEESEHDDQGDATMRGDTVGSEAASAEQRPMQLATEEQLPVLGEDSSHSDTGAQPQQQQEQQWQEEEIQSLLLQPKRLAALLKDPQQLQQVLVQYPSLAPLLQQKLQELFGGAGGGTA